MENNIKFLKNRFLFILIYESENMYILLNTRVRDKKKQEANMKKIGNLAGILYIYG